MTGFVVSRELVLGVTRGICVVINEEKRDREGYTLKGRGKGPLPPQATTGQHTN